MSVETLGRRRTVFVTIGIALGLFLAALGPELPEMIDAIQRGKGTDQHGPHVFVAFHLEPCR